MKRQLLLTMILLMAVPLFIPNIYATTTNQQNSEVITDTSNPSNLSVNHQETDDDQSTTASKHKADEAVNVSPTNWTKKLNNIDTITSKKSNENSNTENIQYAAAAAGDEVSGNVQNNWFTIKDITEAAGRVKSYIETNHIMPNFVKIGTTQITMPQFLQLMTTGLVQLNKANSANINLMTVTTPKNSSENIESGIIKKAEYIDLAGRIQSFINSNGKAPNYASSSLGKIGYPSLIYLYSRIMSYYYNNGVLPQTASLKPWESINNQTASGNQTIENGFTIAQISTAAGLVKTFIEENKRLPNYAEINGKQVTMPQFLQLLNTGLIQIYGNVKSPITMKNVGAPTNPFEDLQSGNIDKSEYLDLASRIQTYLESTGKAPNYASSTLGKIRYETIIYLESRILNFYATNNALPKYAVLNPWQTSNTPSTLSQYLQPTKNCQSNDPTIKSLAASITAGLTSTYDKATAIFNWVNNNTSYAFYWDSKKGALGTLSSGSANCCDHSHLVVALARAVGIPARYQHGNCKFSDGWFGHVWAQLYVDGTWYNADAISIKNTFGVINNWDTSNWTLLGIYAELPF